VLWRLTIGSFVGGLLLYMHLDGPSVVGGSGRAPMQRPRRGHHGKG